MPTTSFTVNDEAGLNAAILSIDQSGLTGTGFTITLSAGFTLNTDLKAINLASGSTLTIDGANQTINGNNQFRGLFVYAGAVVLNSVTLASTLAKGGDGATGEYSGGGGGAGLGGGLFVRAGATVTLSGVNFANDKAQGGLGAPAVGFYGNAGNNVGGGLGSTGFAGTGIPAGYGSGGLGWTNSHPTGYAGNFGAGGGGGYFNGGAGGFGGGGGGGNPGGPGGFGGGAGSGGTGGGGLGAGGAVFVQQGASLIIQSGSLSGSATGGTYGIPGAGLGGAMFIQGTQTVTLAPTASTMLAIANSIADDTGAGTLLLNGAGTVKLSASDSFGGGIRLNAGTLELGVAGSAGSGKITFGGPARLVLDANTLPNSVAGFGAHDSIVLPGKPAANSFGYNATTHVASFTGGSIGFDAATAPFDLTYDAATGTITSVITYSVGDISSLNAAIAAMDVGGIDAATNAAYHITFTANISLDTDLTAINLPAGASLIIDGAGRTLNGGSVFVPHQGFVVLAGTATIGNLTVTNTAARGGLGHGGASNRASGAGGGGGGLGGGLFVGAAGTVTLLGVTFTGNQARGGKGGSYYSNLQPPGYDGGGGSGTPPGTGLGDGGSEFSPGQFGGGGGAGSGSAFVGGFGGGNRAGGGGAGIGGAVFVQLGGSLSFGAGGVGGNSVVGGPHGGSSRSGSLATNGAAFGSGIFIQGSQAITLDPGSLQTLTINDDIADQSGSDPSNVFNKPAAGSLVIAGGGKVVLNSGNNTYTGGTTVSAHSTLELVNDGAGGRGGTIALAGGAVLVLDSIGPTDRPISIVAAHAGNDTIDLPNFAFADGATAVLAGGTLTITSNGASVALAMGSVPAGTQFFAVPDAGTGVAVVACYCAGTRIRTETGDLPIEALRIGDRVVTADGQARPIRWIGRRSYAAAFVAANRSLVPIRIAAGALADGVPARDLLVSPQHALLLDGALVPAMHLLNGASITRATPGGDVHYLHIELEGHGVILAEGAAAETFMDDDSRAMFQNAAEFSALYPRHRPMPATFCAERLDHGDALEAIRRGLASRAGALPEAAPPGPMRGHVERIIDGVAEGWVVDGDNPGIPVILEWLIDGVAIGRVMANQYREDLEHAGLADGRRGFRVACGGHAGNTGFRRASDGARLASAA